MSAQAIVNRGAGGVLAGEGSQFLNIKNCLERDADGGVLPMKQLWGAVEFVRMFRWKLQFGELSRAPMKLLNFRLQGELAECDWVARSHDPWDASLPPHVRRRHASEQALNDAIAVRELLFRALPETQTAVFRIYREMTNADPELVIAGIVDRGDEVANVPSPAMRARLCGLRFWLEDGILGVLGPEEAVLR